MGGEAFRRVAGISAAALLAVWALGAWLLDAKSSKLEAEYLQKRELLSRYDTLKSRWSQKAQKEARRRLETMLRLYGVKATIKKRRGKIHYDFTLGRRDADKILGRILESTLAISALKVAKKGDTALAVHLEVAE
ncbi:hypothetical protein [Hydrogenimonas sp.]